jgi:hypothetical protein
VSGDSEHGHPHPSFEVDENVDVVGLDIGVAPDAPGGGVGCPRIRLQAQCRRRDGLGPGGRHPGDAVDPRPHSPPFTAGDPVPDLSGTEAGAEGLVEGDKAVL